MIQRARFVAVAAMCAATFQVSAQSRASVASDSALLRTMLRTAVREGLTTAHGADAPQLVCVGLLDDLSPGAGWLERLRDPPKSAIADLQKDRTLIVRPMSACRQLPYEEAQRRTSRIQDPLTGKRGILVWVGRPTPSVDGTYTFEFGYNQHELSAGHWRCEVRRRADAWEIASCQLLGVA